MSDPYFGIDSGGKCRIELIHQQRLEVKMNSSCRNPMQSNPTTNLFQINLGSTDTNRTGYIGFTKFP
jgi:hypothetical protein